MNAAAVPALALIGATLLCLGGLPRRVEGRAAPVLCLAGAVLLIIDLLAAVRPAGLELRLGLPGARTALALDGLSAFFMLLVLVTGAAAACVGRCSTTIGAAVLTLLAGDAIALAAGVAAIGLSAMTLSQTAHPADPASTPAVSAQAPAFAIGAAICVIAAFALAGSVGFETIRLGPPHAWRAGAALALTLLGAAALLACCDAAVSRSVAASLARSVLFAGAIPNVAIYVVARAMFDLGGPGQPAGWGVGVLAAGCLVALAGAVRACFAADVRRALAFGGGAQVGFTMAGLGIAWIARAADLTSAAALALGGALICAAVHAITASLFTLCGEAVEQGAGTRAFARLGGLIHAMPATTSATLIGAASLAALPPSGGFAAAWTLFEAMISAPRAGDLGTAASICGAAALLALAIALLANAALRILGIAFLGRPRSPRAAAAVEIVGPVRGAMLMLAGLLAAVGIVPTVPLGLAQPAIRVLLPTHRSDPAPLATLPGAGDGGYSGPAVGILLAVAAAGCLLVLRRGVKGHVTGPAWGEGFDPPPAWLPFGDPYTQISAASVVAPLARGLRTPASIRAPSWAARRAALTARVPRLTARGIVVLGGTALAALLVGVAAMVGAR